MLTKSNFAAIALVMAIVFVLFQFTGVSSSALGSGTTNPYAESGNLSLDRDSARKGSFTRGEGKERILLITGGDSEDGTVKCIREEASYLKRECLLSETISGVREEAGENDVVVIASDALEWRTETLLLLELTEQGIPVIFAKTPKPEELRENALLRRYLGIASVEQDEYRLDGVRIFEGLLLGGEVLYDELSMKLPYYRLDTGVKVYAVGMLENQEEEDIANEELPSLIWRYSQGEGFVFVCNGPFLEDRTGIGFFTGLLCETGEASIYPVVNAQTVMLQSFPYVGEENSEEMHRRYSQEADQFFQEQLWPSVVSILRNNQDKVSCFMTPKLDYSADSQLDTGKLAFFMEQVARENGEVGVSGSAHVSSGEKLPEDFELYQTALPDYIFTTFSSGGLEESAWRGELQPGGLLESVRTLVRPLEELEGGDLLSYYNQDVVQMPILHAGDVHEQEDDLRLRSLESALALSSINVDLKQIVYPEGDEDDWVNVGVDWARFSDTYWKPFRSFDSTLVSVAGERIRQFLALDYEISWEGNQAVLELSNLENEAWFLFRSPYRVLKSVKGGSFEPVEDGVYLIQADSETVTLQFSGEVSPYYYD